MIRVIFCCLREPDNLLGDDPSGEGDGFRAQVCLPAADRQRLGCAPLPAAWPSGAARRRQRTIWHRGPWPSAWRRGSIRRRTTEGSGTPGVALRWALPYLPSSTLRGHVSISLEMRGREPCDCTERSHEACQRASHGPAYLLPRAWGLAPSAARRVVQNARRAASPACNLHRPARTRASCSRQDWSRRDRKPRSFPLDGAAEGARPAAARRRWSVGVAQTPRDVVTQSCCIRVTTRWRCSRGPLERLRLSGARPLSMHTTPAELPP